MNPLAILAGMLACLTARAAEPSPPPQWALMQRAVLVEQDLEKIKKLVAEGFDPNSPIGCGTFSPMDGAVQVGNLAMVETLLKLGATPRGNQLVSTARLDHQTACEIATVLLAAGVSVNGTPDADGEVSSVLHTAVYRNNVGLVTILLKQPGIVLDGFDQDHRTPLMIAVEKGHEDLVDMLLAAGADPQVKNKDGLDASGYADQVIARQNAIKLKLSPAAANNGP